MSEDIDPKEIRKLVDLLEQVERARPSKSFMDAAEMSDMCMCGYKKHLKECLPLNTGVINIVGDICRGCKSAIAQDRKMARVVCLGCRTVVMRTSPDKHPDGFELKANTTYHIERCPVCDSGTTESLIIEKILHLRKRK